MYPGASLWLLLPSVLLSLCRAADPGSWGDWVIVDEAEPGASILLRRITPKSVFVAPTFSCSEGYRQDSLGRCIKHVKVNQSEQWKFYLERLNSMYASAPSKKPQKEAGPFHISLPIGTDSSQEDVVVKKRLPPVIRDQIKRVTSTTTSTTEATTTTLSPPTTTTMPPLTTTTVQESTTPEVLQPTLVDNSEATSTDGEFNSQPEITTESRKKYETTELYDSAVMLGDQPVNTENVTDVETLDTPKNTKQNPSQLAEKPFVIIVTSEPGSRTEESAFAPMTVTTEREVTEVTSESPATTETSTEATTETTSRYTTDSTEYDERFSEVRDTAEPVRYSTSSVRLPCDPRTDNKDCEPAETEIITNPSIPMPSSMPLLESNTRVRFPSDSYVPVRKTQQPPASQNQYVRFPERAHPHDDRPSLWWPSWHVRSHPAIRAWPPPEPDEPMDMLHKQYPPYSQPSLSWSNNPSSSSAWRSRIFQRD